MAYVLKSDQSNVFTGLGTSTFTVMTAGPHFVAAQCTDVPPTGLTFTVQFNGTPIATATSPNSISQTLGINASTNCTVGDVISFIVSSSTTNDTLFNTVKSIIKISRMPNQ